MRTLVLSLVSIFLNLFVHNASAQDLVAIPNARPCIAQHPRTMQPVPVRQRRGPSPNWAHFTWDPDGWPTIVYGPSYFAFGPTMQTFITIHECAHARGIPDEFLANCTAFAQHRFTPDQFAEMERTFNAIRWLPPQYGGSGAAFWAGTKNTCRHLFPDCTGLC